MSGGAPQETADVAPTPLGPTPEDKEARPSDAGADAPVPPAPISASLVEERASPASSPTSCQNCAAPVTGPYCAQCGQKHGHALHSVWHFLREATEDLTHADSRLWRTLSALLTRPGALTREFLDGHRVRYLPPLRLYLVISLLFFLAPHAPWIDMDIQSSNTGRHVQLIESHARQSLTPEQANEGCQMLVEGPSQLLARLGFGGLKPTLAHACRKAFSDGALTYQELLRQNFERAMFIFLPLLAFFAWLLYWRPRHHYVEHLLFFVHNHSFLFLVMAVSRLAASLAAPSPGLTQAVNLLDFVVFVYVCVYLYLAMRRVYGQGRLLTGAKYGALVFFYGVTYVLGMLLTASYTALML